MPVRPAGLRRLSNDQKKKLLKLITKAEKKAVKKTAKKGKRSNTKVDRSDVSLI
jgi:hypothetical protein